MSDFMRPTGQCVSGRFSPPFDFARDEAPCGGTRALTMLPRLHADWDPMARKKKKKSTTQRQQQSPPPAVVHASRLDRALTKVYDGIVAVRLSGPTTTRHGAEK